MLPIQKKNMPIHIACIKNVQKSKETIANCSNITINFNVPTNKTLVTKVLNTEHSYT